MSVEGEELLLEKIISGGQTGADMAGLEAAEKCGLKTGGCAPPGFMTSKGKSSLLEVRFGLEEFKPTGYVSPAQGYVLRSIKNVDMSDATLAFRTHSSAGTDKTIGYCHSRKWGYATEGEYKPCLVISDAVHKCFLDGRLQTEHPSDAWIKDAQSVREFLLKNKVKVLNVCGHRDSAGDPHWQARVYHFLLFCLRR